MLGTSSSSIGHVRWERVVPLWLGLLIVFGCTLGIRLWQLHADAAVTLTWSGAPFTDEGLYSHAARNRVLFGTWRTDGWDDRLVSPLFDGLAYLSFMLLGVGYAQLRLINVVLTVAAVPFWWDILRRDFGAWWALLGTGLWGLNFFWFQYSRLGLLEPGMVVWIVVGAWCWRHTLDTSWRWAVACGVCIGVAYVWKSLALLFVPVPLLACLLSHRWSYWHAGSYLLGLALVLLSYGLLWYLPHHAEIAAYHRFYTADRVPASLMEGWHALANNVRSRYLWGQMPVLAGAALIGLGQASVALWRRELAPAVALCLAWLVCGALLLLMPYSPPRYYTLLMPAVIGLALYSMYNADNLYSPTKLFYTASVLMLVLSWDTYRYVQWHSQQRTTLIDSSRMLQNLVPPGETVLGVAACGLSLENRLPCAPLIAGLANDHAPARVLGARYVLVEKGSSDDFMHRFYPDALAQAVPIDNLKLGPRVVTLYRLPKDTP